MITVPPAVLDALTGLYGTSASQLDHFGGGQKESDGIVYAYPHENERLLLKIMAIPIEEQARGLFCLDERLRFVRYLGENGAHIVYPLRSPQGNLYETYPFESHAWVGYGMAIAPGQSMPETTWDPELFRNWGQAIGRLHRLARHYPSWEASVDPVSGKEHLTWRQEWSGFYDWCQDDDVKRKWVEIKEELDDLPKTRDVFGFIHNDPHWWNLLVDGDLITLLDFDVANHHWFINDIAIACQNILAFHTGGLGSPVHDQEKLQEFLCCFLTGYEREQHLAPAWLSHLNLFIAYRRILMFIVMNDWIRSDAKGHATWKQMILDQPDIVGDLQIDYRSG